jgi:hypothetical protein
MMFVDSNRYAAQNFLNNSEKFKLGGEAGFSAGPVGRAAYAGTNVTLKEETLAYSTAGRGIFGGLDVKATFLGRDFKAAYLASDPQVKLALDAFKALLSQLTTEVPPPAPVAKPIPMIAPLKPRGGVAPENVQTGEPEIQNDPS